MISNKFLLFCALFLSSSVYADVSYTYTGNSFNTFISSNGSYQPFSTSNHIVFDFTTSTLLTANSTFGNPNTPLNAVEGIVKSWSFTDGTRTVTSNNETAFQYFSIATDATGKVDAWHIALLPVSAANNYFMGQILSKNDGVSGCVPGIGSCGTGVQDYAYTGNAIYAFAGASSQGAWVESPVIPSVPEPEEWLFLVLGLPVLVRALRIKAE